MATYFITHIQLGKLTASHNFQRKRIKLTRNSLTFAEWKKLFSNSETLAWSAHYELRIDDQLLYQEHGSGDYLLLEVTQNGRNDEPNNSKT